MIGQCIGNYRVLRRLGGGGMGTVYEALHEQIGHRAAIKALHAELAQNPQVVFRFLNEARAANLIHHLGIVSIYELAQTPAGAPCIIMEYLEGETLRARLQRLGGLGTDTLRLGRQLASALSAAHREGVIHRDLKPDNVMIIADPEAPGGDRVKVLDFGIARMAAELGVPGAGAPHLRTRTGSFMGTPVYMAPEQCRGANLVDDRADVYSLGVMLYEMLAGRPPFVGDLGELIALHLYGQPRPLHELCPAAPTQLCGLLGRMLAKTAAERPAAGEVAAELEQIGGPRGNWPPAGAAGATAPLLTPGGAGIASPLPSTLGQVAGQSGPAAMRRTRGGLLLGAGVFLFIVATFGVVAHYGRGTPGRQPEAPLYLPPPRPAPPLPAPPPPAPPRVEMPTPKEPEAKPKKPAPPPARPGKDKDPKHAPGTVKDSPVKRNEDVELLQIK